MSFFMKKIAIMAADPIETSAERTGLIGSHNEIPIITAAPAILARMARLKCRHYPNLETESANEENHDQQHFY